MLNWFFTLFNFVMLIYLIDIFLNKLPLHRQLQNNVVLGNYVMFRTTLSLCLFHVKKKKKKFFFSSPLHVPVLRPLTLHPTVSLPLSYVAIHGVKSLLIEIDFQSLSLSLFSGTNEPRWVLSLSFFVHRFSLFCFSNRCG